MEFTVLYTHQKTKKSKKWQDGKLRVTNNGKIELYNDQNSRLENVYCKVDQIKVGEEIESDRHLITIEEELRQGKVESQKIPTTIQKTQVEQARTRNPLRGKRMGFRVPRPASQPAATARNPSVQTKENYVFPASLRSNESHTTCQTLPLQNDLSQRTPFLSLYGQTHNRAPSQTSVQENILVNNDRPGTSPNSPRRTPFPDLYGGAHDKPPDRTSIDGDSVVLDERPHTNQSGPKFERGDDLSSPQSQIPQPIKPGGKRSASQILALLGKRKKSFQPPLKRSKLNSDVAIDSHSFAHPQIGFSQGVQQCSDSVSVSSRGIRYDGRVETEHAIADGREETSGRLQPPTFQQGMFVDSSHRSDEGSEFVQASTGGARQESFEEEFVLDQQVTSDVQNPEAHDLSYPATSLGSTVSLARTTSNAKNGNHYDSPEGVSNMASGVGYQFEGESQLASDEGQLYYEDEKLSVASDVTVTRANSEESPTWPVGLMGADAMGEFTVNSETCECGEGAANTDSVIVASTKESSTRPVGQEMDMGVDTTAELIPPVDGETNGRVETAAGAMVGVLPSVICGTGELGGTAIDVEVTAGTKEPSTRPLCHQMGMVADATVGSMTPVNGEMSEDGGNNAGNRESSSGLVALETDMGVTFTAGLRSSVNSANVKHHGTDASTDDEGIITGNRESSAMPALGTDIGTAVTAGLKSPVKDETVTNTDSGIITGAMRTSTKPEVNLSAHVIARFLSSVNDGLSSTQESPSLPVVLETNMGTDASNEEGHGLTVKPCIVEETTDDKISQSQIVEHVDNGNNVMVKASRSLEIPVDLIRDQGTEGGTEAHPEQTENATEGQTSGALSWKGGHAINTDAAADSSHLKTGLDDVQAISDSMDSREQMGSHCPAHVEDAMAHEDIKQKPQEVDPGEMNEDESFSQFIESCWNSPPRLVDAAALELLEGGTPLKTTPDEIERDSKETAQMDWDTSPGLGEDSAPKLLEGATPIKTAPVEANTDNCQETAQMDCKAPGKTSIKEVHHCRDVPGHPCLHKFLNGNTGPESATFVLGGEELATSSEVRYGTDVGKGVIHMTNGDPNISDEDLIGHAINGFDSNGQTNLSSHGRIDSVIIPSHSGDKPDHMCDEEGNVGNNSQVDVPFDDPTNLESMQHHVGDVSADLCVGREMDESSDKTPQNGNSCTMVEATGGFAKSLGDVENDVTAVTPGRRLPIKIVECNSVVRDTTMSKRDDSEESTATVSPSLAANLQTPADKIPSSDDTGGGERSRNDIPGGVPGELPQDGDASSDVPTNNNSQGSLLSTTSIDTMDLSLPGSHQGTRRVMGSGDNKFELVKCTTEEVIDSDVCMSSQVGENSSSSVGQQGQSTVEGCYSSLHLMTWQADSAGRLPDAGDAEGNSHQRNACHEIISTVTGEHTPPSSQMNCQGAFNPHQEVCRGNFTGRPDGRIKQDRGYPCSSSGEVTSPSIKQDLDYHWSSSEEQQEGRHPMQRGLTHAVMRQPAVRRFDGNNLLTGAGHPSPGMLTSPFGMTADKGSLSPAPQEGAIYIATEGHDGLLYQAGEDATDADLMNQHPGAGNLYRDLSTLHASGNNADPPHGTHPNSKHNQKTHYWLKPLTSSRVSREAPSPTVTFASASRDQRLHVLPTYANTTSINDEYSQTLVDAQSPSRHSMQISGTFGTDQAPPSQQTPPVTPVLGYGSSSVDYQSPYDHLQQAGNPSSSHRTMPIHPARSVTPVAGFDTAPTDSGSTHHPLLESRGIPVYHRSAPVQHSPSSSPVVGFDSTPLNPRLPNYHSQMEISDTLDTRRIAPIRKASFQQYGILNSPMCPQPCPRSPVIPFDEGNQACRNPTFVPQDNATRMPLYNIAHVSTGMTPRSMSTQRIHTPSVCSLSPPRDELDRYNIESRSLCTELPMYRYLDQALTDTEVHPSLWQHSPGKDRSVRHLDTNTMPRPGMAHSINRPSITPCSQYQQTYNEEGDLCLPSFARVDTQVSPMPSFARVDTQVSPSRLHFVPSASQELPLELHPRGGKCDLSVDNSPQHVPRQRSDTIHCKSEMDVVYSRAVDDILRVYPDPADRQRQEGTEQLVPDESDTESVIGREDFDSQVDLFQTQAEEEGKKTPVPDTGGEELETSKMTWRDKLTFTPLISVATEDYAASQMFRRSEASVQSGQEPKSGSPESSAHPHLTDAATSRDHHDLGMRSLTNRNQQQETSPAVSNGSRHQTLARSNGGLQETQSYTRPVQFETPQSQPGPFSWNRSPCEEQRVPCGTPNGSSGRVPHKGAQWENCTPGSRDVGDGSPPQVYDKEGKSYLEPGMPGHQMNNSPQGMVSCGAANVPSAWVPHRGNRLEQNAPQSGHVGDKSHRQMNDSEGQSCLEPGMPDCHQMNNTPQGRASCGAANEPSVWVPHRGNRWEPHAPTCGDVGVESPNQMYIRERREHQEPRVLSQHRNINPHGRAIGRSFRTPIFTKLVHDVDGENICSDFVFISIADVSHATVPQRQVQIPVTFNDASSYKQTLTAVLKEHINIILYEVAYNFFSALSKVDVSSYSPFNTLGGSEGNPPCQHKHPSKRVCVKKDGPNKGRFFYACSKPRGSQCKFFQWADQGPARGKSQQSSKEVLNDSQSIEMYLKSFGVSIYCECQLLRKSPFRDILPGAPAWIKKYRQSQLNNERKKLYLKLSRKEVSSVYGKDDLWVLSRDLSFGPRDTFLAKSVFHGPNAASELEIEPMTRNSPSNWSSQGTVHAIHAYNASTELSCLANLQEFVNPQTLPLLPALLSRDPPDLSTMQRSQNSFKSPALVTSNTKQLCCSNQQILDLASTIITKYHLNEDQARALSNVTNMFVIGATDQTHPITLIHGVFGAGKSYLLSVTVLFLVQLFQLHQENGGDANEWKVLIASTTNVAVDRILLSLLNLGFEEFIRVGSIRKIAKPVLPHSVHASDRNNQELKELQEMLKGDLTPKDKNFVRKCIERQRLGINKEMLAKVLAVGVTCAACSFPCISTLKFPVVLLDECSQITEPACLLPVARFGCNKLVLVGDPNQLDPTIQGSEPSNQCNLEQTLFDRLLLMGHEPTLLRTQYRCHPDISAISNQLFYDGKLFDGLRREDRKPLADGFPTVCFYNVANGKECRTTGGSYLNDREAEFVVTMIETLLVQGVEHSQIGVITLYKAQVAHVTTLMQQSGLAGAKELKAIQISTVDAFQGGEKDVIILSCVRSDFMGFAASDKRTNVALTRSRHHLLIVGNQRILAANSLWKRVLARCKEYPEGMKDSVVLLREWKSTLEEERQKQKTKKSKKAPAAAERRAASEEAVTSSPPLSLESFRGDGDARSEAGTPVMSIEEPGGRNNDNMSLLGVTEPSQYRDAGFAATGDLSTGANISQGPHISTGVGLRTGTTGRDIDLVADPVTVLQSEVTGEVGTILEGGKSSLNENGAVTILSGHSSSPSYSPLKQLSDSEDELPSFSLDVDF